MSGLHWRCQPGLQSRSSPPINLHPHQPNANRRRLTRETPCLCRNSNCSTLHRFVGTPVFCRAAWSRHLAASWQHQALRVAAVIPCVGRPRYRPLSTRPSNPSSPTSCRACRSNRRSGRSSRPAADGYPGRCPPVPSWLGPQWRWFHTEQNKRASASDWLAPPTRLDASMDHLPAPGDTDHLGIGCGARSQQVYGATLFPHNIGLGAAHDPDLLREIGAATALEMRATGLEWTFAPTLAVVRDDRWGRTYEGYSEDPRITARYAAAIVTGLARRSGQCRPPHRGQDRRYGQALSGRRRNRRRT